MINFNNQKGKTMKDDSVELYTQMMTLCRQYTLETVEVAMKFAHEVLQGEYIANKEKKRADIMAVFKQENPDLFKEPSADSVSKETH